jgi:predicted DNA-binding protein
MNTKRTSLYLPTEIEQAMKQLAHEHNRSLNGEIIQACKAWIEQYVNQQNRSDVQFWKGIDAQGKGVRQ